MEPGLLEVLGILILGRHAAAVPYGGASDALLNAAAGIGQSQSLGTSPQIMITQVGTTETVEELVPELRARAAVATLELEPALEVAAASPTLELEPVLETSIATTFAIETRTITTTATATFPTLSISLELSIPPGLMVTNPSSPPHCFWEIDNCPEPLPYVHGQLTPGSLGSSSTRPRVAVYCLDESRYVYKWFNVTWIPTQNNFELCHRLKKALWRERMLILGYRCVEVPGWRNWEGGGERKMQATGGRPLFPRKDLAAVLWKVFGDYQVWYEGIARGEELCEVRYWGF